MTRPRLLALALAVLILTAGCTTGVDAYRPSAASTSESPGEQPLATMLAAQEDPVDVLLIGDGTGISLGGWAYLTMQSLGQEYRRPTVIHEWDIASGTGYVEPPIAVADGIGAPISLWNASVSRTVDFLTDALPQMRPPSEIDVVLVNNGLDMGPHSLAAGSIRLMRNLADMYPRAVVVAILQPAPREPEEFARQVRANVRDLDVSSRKNDFQVIDVAASVEAAEGMYDGASRYPSPAGYRLWSQSVVDALIADVRVPAL